MFVFKSSVKFALLAASALSASGLAVAGTLPQGGIVSDGSASMEYKGDVLNIDQTSDKAIIDWNSFSVGKDNTVNFHQPSRDSATLNRVTGDVGSQIAGNINAVGSVFLVNPNGIMITKDGVVDTGNFVASTLDIDTQDFLNGNYTFSKNGKNGVVDNRGTVQVDDGGFVALLGGAVRNEGIVRAHVGKVGFAGGEKIVMRFGDSDFLRVEVSTDTWNTLTDADGNKLSATVDLGGAVESRGGLVDITVADASDILRQTINISGLVSANTVSSQDGVISISGGTVGITGTAKITADANYGDAGTIRMSGGSLHSTGVVSAVADNGNGGVIKVSLQQGANLNDGAHFDVSGRQGGGTLSFIGGHQGDTSYKILGSADFIANSAEGAGGSIDISNKNGLVGLFSGSLSASGKTQGGRIRLGGAFQGGSYDPHTSTLDSKSQHLFVGRWSDSGDLVSAVKTSLGTGVNVDVSSADGVGGTIVLWADHTTNTYAGIDATGGAGGGAVEISAKKQVDSFGLGRINAGDGVILLDPKNVSIGTNWTNAIAQAKKIVSVSGSFSFDSGDKFGQSVSLSDDGFKLAVGAPGDGDGDANREKGAVYLFTVTGSTWGSIVNQATKLDHTSVSLNTYDRFGTSVSLNKDGTKLAVGGIANGMAGKGFVYLYEVNWQSNNIITHKSKIAHNKHSIKISTERTFGSSLSLSDDGDKLAVGAERGDGHKGAVYLYEVNWKDLTNSKGVTAKSKLSNGEHGITLIGNMAYGSSVSLNDNGTKLAVGAKSIDSKGAVYLYEVNWKGLNTDEGITEKSILSHGKHSISLDTDDYFGISVSFSDDGSKLAVGATGDDTGSVADGNKRSELGAVYLYEIDWAKLDATNGVKFKKKISGGNGVTLSENDRFGAGVSLSADGSKLVVGAIGNTEMGAVYPFTIGISPNWATMVTPNQLTFALFIGTTPNGSTIVTGTKLYDGTLDKGDNFGFSISLSDNGTELAVGAPGDGDGFANREKGAVYLYTVSGNTRGSVITQLAKLDHTSVTLKKYDRFGTSVSLNKDGTKLAVGGIAENDAGKGFVNLYTVDWITKAVTHKSKVANGIHSISIPNQRGYGSSVSLSDDGSKLAVGAKFSYNGEGAVHLYTVDWTTLSNSAGVTAKSELSDGNHNITLDKGDNYGVSLSLNDKGDKLAVGASATSSKGAVYLYTVDWTTLSNSAGVTRKSTLSHDNFSIDLDIYDRFGISVSLSDDGSKLAVGATGDDIGSVGNKQHSLGAVYLYEINWGIVDATNGVTFKKKIADGHGVSLSENDNFGSSVSLSANGLKLAVGATGDDNYNANAGAVYLFTVGTTPNGIATVTQTKKLYYGASVSSTISLDPDDEFGHSVSLSDDGTKLAVGAPGDGDGFANFDKGAVYLYTVAGSSWGSIITQTGKLDHTHTGTTLAKRDKFGTSVSLNKDGTKLAVGGEAEDSDDDRGFVSLYTVDWKTKAVTYESKLADGEYSISLGYMARFGSGVSLSDDGDKLAVGAKFTDGGKGAVYLYKLNWSSLNTDAGVTEKLKLSDGNHGITLSGKVNYGSSVSLSNDGTKLVVGARAASSSKGAVYLYEVDWQTSSTSAKITERSKLSDGKYNISLDDGDNFGTSVSLSNDGTKLAVGATGDDTGSAAGGNLINSLGAVYLYTIDWANLDATNGVIFKKKISDGNGVTLNENDSFGSSVSLSADGSKLVVGARGDDTFNPDAGAVYTINVVPKGTITTTEITTFAIKAVLNKGTDFKVVASNDIIVYEAVDTRSDTGSSGKLTLIAGRSIKVDNDVKIKGGLTLIANNTTDVTDGDNGKLILNDRDKGKAEITVATGKTLSGGDGDLLIKMHTGESGGKASKKQTGTITVWKADGQRVSIMHAGTTDTTVATPSDSEIVILSGGAIKSTKDLATKDIGIELVADKFTNNSGANALVLDSINNKKNGSGRYLVWTKTPKDNKMGGIEYDFVQFGKPHNKSSTFLKNTNAASGAMATGSGFIYSVSQSRGYKSSGYSAVDLNNDPSASALGLPGAITGTTAKSAGGGASIILAGAGVAIAVGSSAVKTGTKGTGATGAGAGATGGGLTTPLTTPLGSIPNIFNMGLYTHLNGIEMHAIAHPLHINTPQNKQVSIFTPPQHPRVKYKVKYTSTYDMVLLATNIKTQKVLPLYELNEDIYKSIKDIFVQQTKTTHTKLKQG